MSDTPAFWLGSMPFAGSLLICEPSAGRPITAPAVAAATSAVTAPAIDARLRSRAFMAPPAAQGDAPPAGDQPQSNATGFGCGPEPCPIVGKDAPRARFLPWPPGPSVCRKLRTIGGGRRGGERRNRLYPGVEAMRAGRVSETEGRVARLLAAHGPALRRVARRWSLCEEDAEDALQRSLEIYVRRLATVERATEAAWLKVVIRHEALAIRRARGESVAREDVDLDARTDGDIRALEDRVAERERSARSAEALRELKHDEALALLLKAEGHSYQEIAASQGWTYTKVNRSITEGRARFLKSFRAIEEGEACDRLAPMLAALANGAATAAQLREARPHLRHCATCRAALRALHVPVRRKVAALLPLGAIVQ